MHDYLLWLTLAAYAVHVLEEATLNWKAWAINALHLTNVEWSIFDIANMAVMFIAIGAAMIGWKLPAFALIIPALMLINGIFFHNHVSRAKNFDSKNILPWGYHCCYFVLAYFNVDLLCGLFRWSAYMAGSHSISYFGWFVDGIPHCLS